MRYGLYQLQLSDAVIARIRTSVHMNQPRDSVHEFEAKAQSMLGKPNLGLELGLYAKVAEIEAKDLEDVFEIGNIGPEHKITRIGRMSSVSVGDIIEDPASVRMVVASFGFDPV